MVDGAVSATRSLRDKSQPLRARVDLAGQIMRGDVSIILPRKESVILEWVFDTLAIDPQSKAEPAIWALLNELWPQTPAEAQQRIYKNHKFVAQLTHVLQSPAINAELLALVTTAAAKIAESVSFFGFVADFAVSQLVLAYLNVPCAASKPHVYRQLGNLVFEGVNGRQRLFTKRYDLPTLLREPNAEHRQHYLVDYLSVSDNAVVNNATQPEFSVDDVQAIVSALCEAGLKVPERVIALATAVPQHAAVILHRLHSLQPRLLTANVLQSVLSAQFDSLPWDIISLTLTASPVVLLDDLAKVHELVADPTMPSTVLALLLNRLAQQRQLYEFLLNWSPPPVLSAEVAESLTTAVGTLSAVQVVALLSRQLPSLAHIINSLTYAQAHHPEVRKTLVEVAATIDAKLVVSELVGGFPFANKTTKRDGLTLTLRQMEVQGPCKFPPSEVLDRAWAHEPKLNADEVLLRFFPVLEVSASPEQIATLAKRSSKPVRQQLAEYPEAWERLNVIKSVLDVAIAESELDAVRSVPKAVFTWEQRHQAVAAIISSGTEFALYGDLLIDLIDYQHLPSPEALAEFVSKITTEEAGKLLTLCRVLRKDSIYLQRVQKGLLPWQQVMVSSYLDPKSFASEAIVWMETQPLSMAEPIAEILALLPPSPEISQLTADLSTQLVAENAPFVAKLFGLLASQSYSWPVIAAVYAATNYVYTAEFTNYGSQLSVADQQALVLTAVSEQQYTLLQTLAQAHFWLDLTVVEPSEITQRYRRAVTYAVVEGLARGEESLAFWGFVDASLRETHSLLSQHALEAILEHVTNPAMAHRWDLSTRIISRVLLFKRPALRNRSHLVVKALTATLHHVRSESEAYQFTRLVENWVSPPQTLSKHHAERHQLTSQVARERRLVARVAGVLLQNLVIIMLSKSGEITEWSVVAQALRPAAFSLVDLVHNDGLRAISAGMDNASRAYLRKIFEDYKTFEKWTSD